MNPINTSIPRLQILNETLVKIMNGLSEDYKNTLVTISKRARSLYFTLFDMGKNNMDTMPPEELLSECIHELIEKMVTIDNDNMCYKNESLVKARFTFFITVSSEIGGNSGIVVQVKNEALKKSYSRVINFD